MGSPYSQVLPKASLSVVVAVQAEDRANQQATDRAIMAAQEITNSISIAKRRAPEWVSSFCMPIV